MVCLHSSTVYKLRRILTAYIQLHASTIGLRGEGMSSCSPPQWYLFKQQRFPYTLNFQHKTPVWSANIFLQLHSGGIPSQLCT